MMNRSRRRPGVLVVEDAPSVGDRLRQVLCDDAGVDVVGLARDGLEALRLYDQYQPGLVVLDLHLPRMDGFEVLRRLRARSDSVVVVIWTNQDEDAMRAACLREGASHFLHKTRDLDDLVDIVFGWAFARA